MVKGTHACNIPSRPWSMPKRLDSECDAIDLLCCHPPVCFVHYCTTPQDLAREPAAM